MRFRSQLWKVALFLIFSPFLPLTSLAQSPNTSEAISVIDSEKRGWTTWKNQAFSEADVLNAFSSDMSGIDPLTGEKYDREKAMEGLRKQRVGKYDLSDFKVQLLS